MLAAKRRILSEYEVHAFAGRKVVECNRNRHPGAAETCSAVHNLLGLKVMYCCHSIVLGVEVSNEV